MMSGTPEAFQVKLRAAIPPIVSHYCHKTQSLQQPSQRNEDVRGDALQS